MPTTFHTRETASPIRPTSLGLAGQRGALVLVVGPSALAGRVTRGARAALAHDPEYVFPARYVTGAGTADAPEPLGMPERERNQWTVSDEDFDIIERAGAFALTWRANGRRVGVSCDIGEHLDDGRIVVVEVGPTPGASEAIAQAFRHYSPVRVVNTSIGAAAPGRLMEVLSQTARA